jgi:hypothetical protein
MEGPAEGKEIDGRMRDGSADVVTWCHVAVSG